MGTNLPALFAALLRAKDQEAIWKKTKTDIEQQIAEAMRTDKEEGAVTVEEGGYKVTATYKMSRTLDIDSYDAVKSKIPEGLAPVIYKPSLDIKQLRAIEAANPEVAKLCYEFITVKPAKTAISIKEIK